MGIKKLWGAVTATILSALFLTGCVEEDDPNLGSGELTGYWLRTHATASDNRDIVIQFVGDRAVFAEINFGNWKPLLDNGTVKIGDPKFRNITKSGHLAWTCQQLYRTDAGSTSWENDTFTMNERSDTIRVNTNNGTEIYVRD